MPNTRRAATPLPMSIYQHRYWAKWNQDPQSSSFNTSLVFEIEGPVDRAVFKRACHRITARHEVMHATYSEDGTQQYYGAFGVDDFYAERTVPTREDLEAALKEVINVPFDLGEGPLIHFSFIRHGDRQYFVAKAHHIIADAVAAKEFIADLVREYVTLCRDPKAAAPPEVSYSACVRALNAGYSSEAGEAARAFWRDFLSGVPPQVRFPVKEDEEACSEDTASESIYFEAEPSVTQALRRFAQIRGTTLFVVLGAVFGRLLSVYARQDVVVMSYPVNMRPKDHRGVFGCFVNLALLKVEVDPEASLGVLVQRLAEQRAASRPHLFYPLNKLIHAHGEVRADIETSYFGVFFGETHLNTQPITIGRLALTPLSLPWSRQFDRDLRLLYDPQDPQRIRFRMDFRIAKYDAELIKKFVAELQADLAQIVEDGQ